ncbi:MerR family transcriptional regulator [Tropicimonas sp. IMCC34011]|uniref:MerR family transcriptional regulator n=1 Tax=Tropicimonas sp. IMCC34011 TaxID=2248759 RepID=UPI000E2572A1|nr:MerR family transcriptional regulator [Tropicimonas sp. IMCC34011]
MNGGAHPNRVPLRFHDACDRYGLTPRALRYYEALEILSPERDGRDRVFDARQQVRIELILKGRAYRLRLEEIRQIIELHDTHGAKIQAERWREILHRQRAHLAAERDHLTGLLDRIDAETEHAQPGS